ncbi:MAG: TM2 domain-containing protein [Clostridia bacterium]|nr:TM2 domain-containing protein [Clostridia bacterium]
MDKVKTINKYTFFWSATFFGAIGLDRFERGQIGLGILKLITIGGCGLWALIDWIIAIKKVYGSAYKNDSEITFINGKYSK